MRAVYCTGYGSVENLKIVEIEKPVIGKNDILVQVMATTVQTADWRIRTLEMPEGMGFMAKLFFGFKGPKQPVLGTEFSGKIVAIGDAVTKFKINDEIIAATGPKLGAHAEYVKISETGVIIKKPVSVSFQEGASLAFGGITALDFLKYRAQVKPGENILINGASGAVGTAAIQIAKILGANVTAVCSKANEDFVKSLGANQVIDYSLIRFWEGDLKYDVIFDIVGDLSTQKLLKALKPTGRLILVSAGLGQMVGSVFKNLFSNQKVFCGVASETKEYLLELAQLAAGGKYKSVVDRKFSMDEIAEAHLRVQGRHKRGNVVICVSLC